MLKGGLVIIWELDMNLVPTLLYILFDLFCIPNYRPYTCETDNYTPGKKVPTRQFL